MTIFLITFIITSYVIFWIYLHGCIGKINRYERKIKDLEENLAEDNGLIKELQDKQFKVYLANRRLSCIVSKNVFGCDLSNDEYSQLVALVNKISDKVDKLKQRS